MLIGNRSYNFFNLPESLGIEGLKAASFLQQAKNIGLKFKKSVSDALKAI